MPSPPGLTNDESDSKNSNATLRRTYTFASSARRCIGTTLQQTRKGKELRTEPGSTQIRPARSQRVPDSAAQHRPTHTHPGTQAEAGRKWAELAGTGRVDGRRSCNSSDSTLPKMPSPGPTAKSSLTFYPNCLQRPSARTTVAAAAGGCRFRSASFSKVDRMETESSVTARESRPARLRQSAASCFLTELRSCCFAGLLATQLVAGCCASLGLTPCRHTKPFQDLPARVNCRLQTRSRLALSICTGSPGRGTGVSESTSSTTMA